MGVDVDGKIPTLVGHPAQRSSSLLLFVVIAVITLIVSMGLQVYMRDHNELYEDKQDSEHEGLLDDDVEDVMGDYEQDDDEHPDLLRADDISYNGEDEEFDDSNEDEVEEADHDWMEVILRNNIDQDTNVYIWNEEARQEELLAFLAVGESVSVGAIIDDIVLFRHAETGQLIRSVLLSETVLFGDADILAEQDQEFFQQYFNETGEYWRNIHPRDPVQLHMYGAGKELGHIELVTSEFPYWNATETSVQLSIEKISGSPLIVRVENFMSKEECALLVQQAEDSGKFQRSSVANSADLDDVQISVDRTSHSFFLYHLLDANSNEIVENITKRMFDMMRIPYRGMSDLETRAEVFQMLRYGVGDQYKAHTDWFDTDSEENCHDKEILRGRNRFATCFIYLSDVVEGGETAFPLAEGHETEADEACENGFRVTPKAGTAIIFYSMKSNGNLDDKSLHIGCPVKSGRKYAANAWFWEPVRFTNTADGDNHDAK